jgi:predicted amidophosphoribosyltransferase
VNPAIAAALDALAILAPVSCAGCGADDRGLCSACRAQLVPTLVEQRLDGGLSVVSALPYDGVARRSILALKEQGRTDLARPLGRVLAVAVVSAIDAFALGTDCSAESLYPAAGLDLAGPNSSGPRTAAPVTIELAIMPASSRSYRRRGYDPVRLLARRAGAPIARVGLRAGRGIATQKTLDREGRKVNLVNSMRATRRLNGRRLMLLDDVVTTGSTLLEAARALRSAGADVVGCVTLAYTPRRLLGVSLETTQSE